MKLFKFIVLSLAAFAAFALFVPAMYAKADTVPQVGIKISDAPGGVSLWGCPNAANNGVAEITPVGGGTSSGAGDSNWYEGKCGIAYLSSVGPFTQDFRIGIRLGNSRGGATQCTDFIAGGTIWGPWAYTPWASQAGSTGAWSSWTTDNIGYDVDCYQLTIQTSTLPSGTYLTKTEFGIQFANANHSGGSAGWFDPSTGCYQPPGQLGGAAFTGYGSWMASAGGWSYSSLYDPSAVSTYPGITTDVYGLITLGIDTTDCAQAFLASTLVGGVPVTSNIPANFNPNETKTVDTDNGNPLSVTMKNTGNWVWAANGEAAVPSMGVSGSDCSQIWWNDIPSPDPTGSGGSCTSWADFTSEVTLQHSGSFTVNPAASQSSKLVQVTLTTSGGVWDYVGCPDGSDLYLGYCDTPEWVLDPGAIVDTYSQPTGVIQGESVTYPITSMTAPSGPGTYNENWTLNDGPFGVPAVVPITVGPGLPTSGTVNVISEDGSGNPVSAQWTISGPPGAACASGCSGSGANPYASQPFGSYSVTPVSGSAGASYSALPTVSPSGNQALSAANSNITFTLVWGAPPPPTTGTINVISQDSSGNPVNASWTISGPPGAACASGCSGSGANPYANQPVGSYTVVGTPGSAGASYNSTPSVSPASLPLAGGGNITFTVTWTPVAAPTVTLSASPNPVTSGNQETLTWSTGGGPVTSCTASGDWSGSEPASGVATVTVSGLGTKTYTLTCTGPGGSGSDSKSVTVNPAPVTVTPVEPAGSGPLANQPGPVPVGVPVPLSCTGGTGSYSWTSNPSAGASFTSGGSYEDVTYSNTGTYTVTCTDSNGNSGSTTVIVTGDCTISANPTSLVPPQTSTLTWSCPTATVGGTTVNVASSCTINGASSISGTSVNTGGTASVSPSSNPASYTLACTAAYGDPSNNAIPPYTATITVGGPGVCETNPNGTGCQ